MSIITISRQSGSLGDELANYLAGKLNCEVITRSYAMENFFGDDGETEEAEESTDDAAAEETTEGE